jgi:nitroimidazol reductase NimA-like FMN-containing flavoprotein (pyridoxamine 5'-phosphate oxidase superfamily)
MQLIDLNSGLEVIDRAECLRLLAGEEVGRLGVVVGGRPEIFPVNFALDGDCVIFRTDPGTKLAAAIHDPVVFEVDRLDHATRSAWSVIIHGRADHVTAYGSPSLLHRTAHLDLYPWSGASKAYLLRIVPNTITGRRIQPREPGRAKTAPTP